MKKNPIKPDVNYLTQFFDINQYANKNMYVGENNTYLDAWVGLV